MTGSMGLGCEGAKMICLGLIACLAGSGQFALFVPLSCSLCTAVPSMCMRDCYFNSLIDYPWVVRSTLPTQWGS